MAVSKAYLRRLGRVVKDREVLAAIRKFLVKYDEQINTNNLVITREGDVYYEGSIGNFTFYKLWGKHYRRKKSSLTTKRFRKDKAFQGSRESAERFALGNKLASKLYKLVDAEKKAYKLFCHLKKRAIELIKEGKTVEEAKEILMDYLRSLNLLREERRNDAPTFQTGGSVNSEEQMQKPEGQKLVASSTLGIFNTGMPIKPKFPVRGTGGRHRAIRTQLALAG